VLAYQNTPTVLAVPVDTTQAGFVGTFYEGWIVATIRCIYFFNSASHSSCRPTPLKNQLSVYLQLQVPRFKYANLQRGDSAPSPTTHLFLFIDFAGNLPPAVTYKGFINVYQ
jgi:hypothetical protein